jgi:hypothetical protein
MRKQLTKNSIILACVVVTLALISNSVAAQSTWSAFWQKFKTAVVKGDKQTVLSLSKESLSDADYKQLFGTRAKQNCFAKARPIKEEPDAYSVFCGEQGYYFEKIDGHFKFIEAFAND